MPRNASLPDELRQFHDLCGGVLLFEDASFPRRVCGPGGFVPASPRLLTPEVAQQVAKDNPADLTNNCYVIVDGGQGLSTEPHVVMDLAPQRSGRCYTAAWDTYGLPGEMPLIATTIVELLQALLVDRGVEALPAGLSAGDAYDL
ncbi:hypothetical protein Nm8I071_38310 [Nonomuraea sp. TT08I-71]|nr:hypothetical protein Nm8I071_38310 [Nonomuraea sp. TT08I-71]